MMIMMKMMTKLWVLLQSQ